MGRQTINLQTFGRDLNRNLLHLFDRSEHQTGVDRTVLVLSFKVELLESELARMDRELNSLDEQIKAESSRSARKISHGSGRG